ncbi:MAG: hypothetical protein ACFFD8_07770, partial [Candidatus Thorarchaeota archaeon]
MVSTSTLVRWEYKRLLNYLRVSLRRPIFLAVQVLSIAVIVLVIWVLYFLMIDPNGLSFNIRNMLLGTLVQNGLVGPNAINAVWLAYAIITVILVKQIIKAVLNAPLSSEIEVADVDFIFPSPLKGRVFFTAKYLRSIPRRIMVFFWVILAFQPILWAFGQHRSWQIPLWPIVIFVIVAFLLGEIGAIATHGLYSIRKIALQPRAFRRIYRILFYLILGIGVFLLLSPVLLINGTVVMSPLYNLAYMMVALGSGGRFASLYPPAIPWVVSSLIFSYFIILILTRYLYDHVTIDLHEEIATVARSRGTALGFLSRLNIEFNKITSPHQAILRKDFVSGFRKPGKTFYIIGIITNFVFAIMFMILIPTIGTILPLPPSVVPFMNILYAILLVVIIPLIAITASDPYQSEYGTLYLLKLAQVGPRRFTIIKYIQLLVSPFLLSIPFAIYFAVILGQIDLLFIALAILPHAILLSTAIGVGLGSRYPFASRAKNETPIALMITFPLFSWIATLPILIIQLGFLPAGVELMLF